jgi:serine/threonine protein kinase
MDAVPTTFGKYFLTEKIATGGMAEIYLAKLIGPGGFEKQLIIKQIHPEFSGHRQFVELFVAEAKTLVGLSHGNIVPIYELGVVDDTYYISMEYIDGPTLERLMKALRKRERPLDSAMAAYMTSELLKGLDYAHRKGEGVIHRDLSPRNVMVSRDGEVKLVDFGLAVTIQDQKVAAGAGGRPAGSFPYMSPEQVRSEPLTGQSDLFSVGVLLWELLTGQALFARKGEDETLEAVLSGPIPPPSEVNKKAPKELDAICLKALARDLDERYATANDFLSAINRYVYSLDTTITPIDVSRMLAIATPPTTTERTAVNSTGSDADATADTQAPRDGIDRTKPMPPRARGKSRAETTRSFATHIELEEALSNATPAMGYPAITDSDAGDAKDSGAEAKPVAKAKEPARATTEPPPKSFKLAAIAGLVVAGSITAFAVWPSSPGTASNADAGRVAAVVQDAGAPADSAPALYDATAVATTSADAAPLPDAKKIVRRPKPDARSVAAVGKGTLKVGANPWGEVFVDGKKVGQAPGVFKIEAGPHAIEIRYRRQVRAFNVTIEPDQTASLGVIEFDVE